MNYYNYFTEVEEHFVRRRGKHMWVSPLDWSLISTWKDSGVPMHIALRGIDKAMDSYFASQARPHKRLSTLFYCHSSVMEEYAQYLESHQGEGEPSQTVSSSGAGEPSGQAENEGPTKQAVLEFLEKRIFEIRSLFAKQFIGESAKEALERLILRLEEIRNDLQSEAQIDTDALERDLSILDGLLVTELRSWSPAEQIAEWEQEAKSELKIYKRKLPKDTYQKILDNFLRDKLRRFYDIGELSLFHL
jgi:hypothetical protein